VQVSAGAFIGAYWSVYDEPPSTSRRRSTRGCSLVPIGEAVKQACIAVRAEGIRRGLPIPSSRIARERRGDPGLSDG
jgi:hypothetical protein